MGGLRRRDYQESSDMVQSVESSLNPAEMQVGGLIRRARAAQQAIESYDQGRVDVMVAAVS